MTPKAVVNAIEQRLGLTGSPRDLRDAIETELLSRNINAASAADLLYSIRSGVAVEIARRRNEREGLGEIAVVHLRGDQGEIVHGSSFVFEDDQEDIRKAKLNRIFADEIYSYIKTMTFTNFEKFGRSILRELGCKTAKVTPNAGDQGIDFYGDFNLGDLVGANPSILRLMHETRVVLVRQAKHYPNSVIGPSVVRELVGALALARTATYSKENVDLLNSVELRPFSPLLALLFSTGTFTKGARHLAKRAGLITYSGWQLAVFLSDRGVGLVDQGGSTMFSGAAFDTWLE